MSQDTGSVEPESGEAGPPPSNPRFLKGLVIVMGVLLVVGFIVVFATIIYRAVNLPSSPGARAAASWFGDLPVTVPAGYRVAEMIADGSRLHVRVSGSEGEQILVIDTRSGALVGRVVLQAGTP